VSSAAKGFGGALISAYVSLHFVELGGSPITLGLMTAMASVSLLRDFLFQTFNSASPFYLFTAAELMVAFFLIGLVREPAKKEA